MKNGFLVSLFITLIFSFPVFSGQFTACKGTYALCTTAECTPIPGEKDTVACQCEVRRGFSAATKSCESVKETPKGQLIRSRYYPVTSYAICANDRSWAWCLNKPCIIDKNDPTKAVCACSTVKNLGNYVIVTNSYDQSTCTTGIISSATVQQITEITDFLRKQSVLTPFPIKVISQ